jgi:hypothetical protein
VTERHDRHEAAATLLDRVSVDALPPTLRDRVRLRRVTTWSALAFERARRGRAAEAQAASVRATRELMLVARPEVAEWDVDTYDDAALRAAVARSGMEIAAAIPAPLRLLTKPKPTGETCLALVETKAPEAVLFERCTYGVVWPSSVRVAPNGRALAVAVQPTDDWRELWLFQRRDGSWTVDVLAPASEHGLGYIEWAGWTPDGTRVLAARESSLGGRRVRSFEVLRLDTLAVERRAGRPADLTPFHRWQSPDWKAQTLALR